MVASQKFNPKKWKGYYSAKTACNKPTPLLARAIQLDKSEIQPRVALDLGCGTGNDTHLLLKKKYVVHAIDAQKYAISHLHRVIPKPLQINLVTRVIRFEEVLQRDLPCLSLINASFSIFFCRRSSFPRLWQNLNRRLEKGGIFCGQLLGLRDDWANIPGYTATSKREIKKIFWDFEIIELSEHEDDAGTLTGRAKHWHFYNVLAKKENDCLLLVKTLVS